MSLSNPGVRLLRLFLAFAAFAPRALAQFGSCQPGWEWANNTLNQNPCEIAGALDAQCEGFDVFVLGPLPQGANYVTPQKNDTGGQMCNCNTVMFSLYMACTACQNVTTQPWSFWRQYCDNVYITQYPGTIPLNTAVPHWAFLNYTIGDQFDPVAAKAAGDLPETVAPVPSTISLSSTSSTRPGSPSSTVNPTNQGGDNGVKRPSNTGAIAGGVIGGLAALGLICVGIWMFFRRRSVVRGGQGYPEDIRVATGAAPMSEHGVSPLQSLRPYDPSDPSTYPTHVDYGSSEPYTTASKGHYTGAAEL